MSELLTHKQHHFWPSPDAKNPAIYLQALGHQQVNDAYLVALARRQRGRLVTLDSKLPIHAGDEALLSVIAS